MNTKIVKYGRELATGQIIDMMLEAKSLVTLVYTHFIRYHGSLSQHDHKEAEAQLSYMRRERDMFIDTVEIDIKGIDDKIKIYKFARSVIMRMLWEERDTYKSNRKMIQMIHKYCSKIEIRLKELELMLQRNDEANRRLAERVGDDF